MIHELEDVQINRKDIIKGQYTVKRQYIFYEYKVESQ